MTRAPLLALGAAVLLSVAACGSSNASREPPGQPPKPETVTVAEPGGDAHDPHLAALDRELTEPWGERNDKDNQVLLPLPDVEHWKRVRYFGVEHLVGFRYGDEHHAIAIAFVQNMPEGTPIDSRTCLKNFEAWARPQTKGFDVQLENMITRETRWRDKPLTIKSVDGHADVGFSRRSFSAAWAGYPAYPDACLVYAVAVPWRESADSARKVRDRFLTEAFERVNPLTPTKPERK